MSDTSEKQPVVLKATATDEKNPVEEVVEEPVSKKSKAGKFYVITNVACDGVLLEAGQEVTDKTLLATLKKDGLVTNEKL